MRKVAKKPLLQSCAARSSLERAVATARRLLANPFGVAMFRGIAPTRLRLATAWQAERGGYSLREMAQQHGPFQYFNSLLEISVVEPKQMCQGI